MHKLGSCSHIAEDGDIFFLGKLNHMIGCFAVVVGVGLNIGLHRSFRLLIFEYHNKIKFEAIKEGTLLTNIMEGINLSKAMRYIECCRSAAVESVLYTEKVKMMKQSFGGVSKHMYSNLFAGSFVCRLKRNASAVVVRPGAAGLLTGIECSRVWDSS